MEIDKKCKVGFWKWLLINTPIELLGVVKSGIRRNPYEHVMVVGAVGVFIGLVLVPMLFSSFEGVTVTIICLIVALWGHYKMYAC